jgi:bud emergence protein 1
VDRAGMKLTILSLEPEGLSQRLVSKSFTRPTRCKHFDNPPTATNLTTSSSRARAISPTAATASTVSSPRSTPVRASAAGPSPRQQTFYAVVLHDFTAERTDELDAKVGDPITVVAQSNEEWFVAKPIGRLGRPGLIPVSFVELRDPATNLSLPDVSGIMARGELPKVEDWKRAMHEYKQSSISLGVLDEKPTAQGSQQTSPPPQPKPIYGLQTPPTTAITRPPVPMEPLPEDRPPTPVSMQDPNILPPGTLISAEVVDYHFENEEYWFRINAIYQPEDPSSSAMLPAHQLVLFRVYDDFYDFQIALLDAFPVEAGRENGPPSPQSEGGPTETEPTRILPYMPGPVTQVDDVVTSLRREELDDYLRQLCALREISAEHVLRHSLVRNFFSSKPGDVETIIQPTPGMDTQSTPPQPYQDQDRYQDYEEVRNGVGSMSLGKNRLSDDSRYEEEYGRSGDYEYHPTERVPSRNDLHAHARSGSTASLSLSRGMSPHPGPSPREGTGQYYRRTDSTPLSDGGQVPSPSRQTSTPRSNPTISATNPQTAFLKIKIFHRQTDDLIAIRVNPRVSHMQLMEKVRERLGDEIQAVSYRRSITGAFADLQDDYSLREWLDHSDKHVLYAS